MGLIDEKKTGSVSKSEGVEAELIAYKGRKYGWIALKENTAYLTLWQVLTALKTNIFACSVFTESSTNDIPSTGLNTSCLK